jgi:RimJ/RimL family protein N-acetyltransferase
MIPILDTPRLRLRPLAASDEADLVALDSDPEVMRYVGSPPGVTSPAETAERARRRIRESERGDYAPLGFWRIEARTDGTFHGVGALIRMPDTEDNRHRGALDVEVAYRLARSAWGRGLATEAARAALAYGFGEAGLHRIVAVTRPEHARSRHVLEKLGMRYERDVDVFGIHAVLYALARSEPRPSGSDGTDPGRA